MSGDSCNAFPLATAVPNRRISLARPELPCGAIGQSLRGNLLANRGGELVRQTLSHLLSQLRHVLIDEDRVAVRIDQRQARRALAGLVGRGCQFQSAHE